MQRKPGFATMIFSLTVFCASAGTQMVVHAVSGVVKAINPDSKTMDVTVEGGAGLALTVLAIRSCGRSCP